MKTVLKHYVHKLRFASELCRFCLLRAGKLKRRFPGRKKGLSTGNRRGRPSDPPPRPDSLIQITIIIHDEPIKQQ